MAANRVKAHKVLANQSLCTLGQTKSLSQNHPKFKAVIRAAVYLKNTIPAAAWNTYVNTMILIASATRQERPM